MWEGKNEPPFSYDLFQLLCHVVIIKGLTALYALCTGDVFNDVRRIAVF